MFGDEVVCVGRKSGLREKTGAASVRRPEKYTLMCVLFRITGHHHFGFVCEFFHARIYEQLMMILIFFFPVFTFCAFAGASQIWKTVSQG